MGDLESDVLCKVDVTKIELVILIVLEVIVIDVLLFLILKSALFQLHSISV